MKKKLLCMLVAAVCLLPMVSVAAQSVEEFVFEDLRHLAPEGTFLAPGEAPIADMDSYKSENISVTITRRRVDDADVTIADIYVSSVRHLRRAFSNGTWKGKAERVRDMALSANAVIAISGDYASMLDAGLVVGNGEVYRQSNNNKRDNCLIYPDGRMVTYARKTLDAKEALQQPVWRSFLFGPMLLDENGQPFDKFDSKVGVANPRSVIGYYSPGHYCFVLVDGRSNASKGLAMVPLSRLMAELGCQAAYNLDGGQSAMMYFRGAIITDPYKGGRSITDVVYIGE